MPQNCSNCGGEIPEGSNLGACPSCLLAVGLEQGAQLTPTSINVDSLGDYEVLEEIALNGVQNRRRRMKGLGVGRVDLID